MDGPAVQTASSQGEWRGRRNSWRSRLAVIVAFTVFAAAFPATEVRAQWTGPSLTGDLIADLIAVSSDRTDSDGDGLPDTVELAIGTDPGVLDTDSDGIGDGLEATAGHNPLAIDTNIDGLADGFELDGPVDPDGDGWANVDDPDNDNDGVHDGWDLSPFGRSAITTEATLSLEAGDGSVSIDIQVRPDAEHKLYRAGTRFNWPDGDRFGLMQDLDNSEEDVVLSPALLISAPSGPGQEQLASYGITLREPNPWAGEADSLWKAHVPLLPVSDNGKPLAFAGRIFLPAGEAPEELTIEFAWLVRGLTDAPSATVLHDAAASFGDLPEGAVLENVDHPGTCVVESSTETTVTCRDPLSDGASFKGPDVTDSELGDRYRIHAAADTASSPVYEGTATETEIVTAPTELARYRDEFVITGLSVSENRGTDAAMVATSETSHAFHAAAAIDASFVRTQRAIADALTTFDAADPSVVATDLQSYDRLDQALVGIPTTQAPRLLGQLPAPDPVSARPLLAALEERSASGIIAEWDTATPSLDGTTFTATTRGEPTITAKTLTMIWYAASTGSQVGPTEGLAAIGDLPISEDDRVTLTGLGLVWMAGVSEITRIGATPISTRVPVPDELAASVISSIGGLKKAGNVVHAGLTNWGNNVLAKGFGAAERGFLDVAETLGRETIAKTGKIKVFTVLDWVKDSASGEVAKNLLTKTQGFPKAASVANKALKWGKSLKIAGQALSVVGIALDLGSAVNEFLAFAREYSWSLEGIGRGVVAALPDLISAGLGFASLIFMFTNPAIALAATIAAVVLAILVLIGGKALRANIQGFFFGYPDQKFPVTEAGFVADRIGAPKFTFRDWSDNGLTADDTLHIEQEVGTFASTEPNYAKKDGGTRRQYQPKHLATKQEVLNSRMTPGLQTCTDYRPDDDENPCDPSDLVGGDTELQAGARYSPSTFETAEPTELCRDVLVGDPAASECRVEWDWVLGNELPLDRAGVNNLYASRIAYTGHVMTQVCTRWLDEKSWCKYPNWDSSWDVAVVEPANGALDWAPLYLDVLPETFDEFIAWRHGDELVLGRVDSDGDGLTDTDERAAGTPTRRADSDRDGLSDLFELSYRSSEGLALDPLERDTDGDNLTDGVEFERGTDPLDPDSDDDGLNDFVETNGWWTTFFHGGVEFMMYVRSDPLRADTDLDGLTDDLEYERRSNPWALTTDDFVACDLVQPTVAGLVGTPGDDRIVGTPGDDVIDGGSGDDIICGMAGSDKLFGDDGDDILDGGDGNDRIRGGDGADTIYGQAGRDVLQGGDGNDIIVGGRNNDRISGNGGRDELHGGNGRDRIDGQAGPDTISGGGGNDRLLGGGGNDLVNGNVGTDFCAEFETVRNCEQELAP